MLFDLKKIRSACHVITSISRINMLVAFIYLDYDECFENANDCGGSRCRNGVGTFRCECPANLIDISDDFKMLEGRKCIGNAFICLFAPFR